MHFVNHNGIYTALKGKVVNISVGCRIESVIIQCLVPAWWIPPLLETSLAEKVYGIKDWKEIIGPFNPAPLFCLTLRSKEGNQLFQNHTARWYQRGGRNPGSQQPNSCLKGTLSGILGVGEESSFSTSQWPVVCTERTGK